MPIPRDIITPAIPGPHAYIVAPTKSKKRTVLLSLLYQAITLRMEC